jgi:hypothetical protein
VNWMMCCRGLKQHRSSDACPRYRGPARAEGEVRMQGMTWSELTDLIKALASLAWPVMVLLLVLSFKGKIGCLLSNRKL